MTAMQPKTFGADASKSIALAESLNEGDLQDLCDATVDAIEAGGGFGWLSPPPRDTLERYWQGLMLIPDRRVFVARLDGLIAGSIQLHLNPRNNEAQAMLGRVTSAFIATWARGSASACSSSRSSLQSAAPPGTRRSGQPGSSAP